MTVLLITATGRDRIAEIIAVAQESPIRLADVVRLSEGFDPDDHGTAKLSPSHHPKYHVQLGDHRVVYTHEEQLCGMCRHMSVSIPARGRLPLIAAVEMIMEEFGFRRPIEKCLVWLEEIGEDRRGVNVLEPMDDDAVPNALS